jgi:uncharacterized membrane protein YesL
MSLAKSQFTIQQITNGVVAMPWLSHLSRIYTVSDVIIFGVAFAFAALATVVLCACLSLKNDKREEGP